MFHVPETYRIVTGRFGSNSKMGNNGFFVVPSPLSEKRQMLIIASDGYDWEHLSIHIERGNEQMTPLWDEMCYLKDLFWDAEDVVMQLHPKQSEYVNNHPHTLHLWRPFKRNIPTPPSILVGLRGGPLGNV